MQLGTPAVSQESFIVEGALNRVRSEAMGIIRRLLQACENTEANMIGAQKRMKASQVGNITLNANESRMLDGEYNRWTARLAEALGCPRNPYSSKFTGGRPSLNIPVWNT